MEAIDHPTTRAGHGTRPEENRTRVPGRLPGLFLDAEGNIRSVDPACARALGYPPLALEGAFFFAYVHARDLSRVLADAAGLLQHRMQGARWQFLFRAADGRWRPLAACVERVATPDEDGLLLTFSDRLPAPW